MSTRLCDSTHNLASPFSKLKDSVLFQRCVITKVFIGKVHDVPLFLGQGFAKFALVKFDRWDRLEPKNEAIHFFRVNDKILIFVASHENAQQGLLNFAAEVRLNFLLNLFVFIDLVNEFVTTGSRDNRVEKKS